MDRRQLDRIAKALADPRRLDILEAIAREREISCKALGERFPVGLSTVSHHLKVLADSGVVRVRREGQFGYFSLDREVLRSYLQAVQWRLLGTLADPGPPESGSRAMDLSTKEVQS